MKPRTHTHAHTQEFHNSFVLVAPTSGVLFEDKKMAPHGGGMLGAGHSHDPEYPDDDWNLYAMLDRDRTTALNVTNPAQAIGIFKPFAMRLTEQPSIISDADPEILVVAAFTSPVHIRKIMVSEI
jgi:hypothetical protein